MNPGSGSTLSSGQDRDKTGMCDFKEVNAHNKSHVEEHSSFRVVNTGKSAGNGTGTGTGAGAGTTPTTTTDSATAYAGRERTRIRTRSRSRAMEGGLTFEQARSGVLSVLESLEGFITNDMASRRSFTTNWYHILLFSSCPLLSALLLIIAGVVVNYTDSIISGSILVIIVLINAAIILRTSKQEYLELTKEISVLTEAYSERIKNSSFDGSGCGADGEIRNENTLKNRAMQATEETSHDPIVSTDPMNAEEVERILSGHPHISIVTCYRDGEWQRIPTLLLAKGDVVALMAGDITPCKVYELFSVRMAPPFPERSNSRKGVEKESVDFEDISQRDKFISLGDSLWQKGNLIESQTMIHLRNKLSKWTDKAGGGKKGNSNVKQAAKRDKIPSYERHRSVPSISTELLALSGDVRCFLVAETPMKKFGEELLENPSSSRINLLASIHKSLTSTEAGTEVENRKESYIRTLFVTICKEVFYVMVRTVFIFLLLACIRAGVLESDESSWWSVVIVPTAVILLSFSYIALPCEFLVCEAVALSKVLSKIEALLQEEASIVNPSMSSDPNPLHHGHQYDTIPVPSSGSKHSKPTQPSIVSYLKRVCWDNFIPSSRQRAYTGINEMPSMDIGINRGHESLRNSSHFEGELEFSDHSSDGDFDDDDLDERAEELAEEASHRIQFQRQLKYALHILCSRLGLQEGWRHSNNDLLPVPMSKMRLLETLGAVTMVCFVDDDVICESFSVTEEVFLLQSSGHSYSDIKTKVLDLHANPEARGSRFENPQWFTYLPSLKPIGLNAILTYSPFPPQALQLSDLEFRDGVLTLEGYEENANIDTNAYVSNDSSRKWTTLKDYSSFSKYKASRNRRNRVEVALVDHVRRCVPLEALKELAEEIGFVDEDYTNYSRLLEMNVLAPRLLDLKVVEDTHAWGQEETRRRGTLETQVRGVLIKDPRGGGLQIMSQGNPALVLNYSKEYWDGSNITPLTAADRTEALKVYNRWDLEDYDVVGFSYTPVPFYLHNTIIEAYGENPVRIKKNGIHLPSMRRRGENENTYFTSQENSLYFVDPRTEKDLLPKYKQLGDPPGKYTDDAVGENFEDTRDEGLAIIETENRPRTRSSNSNNSSTSITQSFRLSRNEELAGDIIKSSSDDALYFTHVSSSNPSLIRDVYSSNDIESFMGRDIHEHEEDERDDDGDDDVDEEELDVDVDVDELVEGHGSREVSIDSEASVDVDEEMNGDPVGLDLTEEIADNDDNNRLTKTKTRKSEEDFACSCTNVSLLDEFSSKGNLVSRTYKRSEMLGRTNNYVEMGESSSSRSPTGLMESSRKSSEGHDVIDTASATLCTNGTLLLAERELNKTKDVKHPGEQILFMDSPPELSHLPTLTRSFSLNGALNKLRKDDSKLNEQDPLFDERAVLLMSRDDSDLLTVEHGSPKSAQSPVATKTLRRAQSSSKIPTTTGSVEATTKSKRSIAASLWPFMRQQVFLGMAASSVPVKPEVPKLVEDLTSAGIRFVYFSPRNMRRSKPLANKIGIETDWNCAISLRDLEGDSHDPHRMSSANYTDWDVMAQMPHGVDAIRRHLSEVDNVPLLVSLYTDATAETTKQMVNIFRDYGETVLTVGSGYREANCYVFRDSDAAISVSMLPGNFAQIPIQARAVMERYPSSPSTRGLCRHDIQLVLSLIGIGALPFLQLPYTYQDHQEISMCEDDPDVPKQARLSTMLESVRDGRVILLNMYQMIAMFTLGTICISTWHVVALAIPISKPPTLPPFIALMFAVLHLPGITLSMLFSPANDQVMKNTPRKNIFEVRSRDRERFALILSIRVALVVTSIFIISWMVAVDTINEELAVNYIGQFNRSSDSEFNHVQDVTSFAMLLAIISQASSMLHRGQKLTDFPSFQSHPAYYISSGLSVTIHLLVLMFRAYLRENGLYYYSKMSWILYFLVPSLTMFCGIVVHPLNKYDDNFYRRYLEFLRLEFDTRLGMHSPR